MKTFTRLGIVAGLALAAVAAIADEAADLTKSMQAGMNAYVACVMKKDWAGAEKIIKTYFSPKCTMKTTTGQTMTRDQWITTMMAQTKMLKSISKMSMKVVSIKVNGNKATGSETFEMVATIPNMQDPKKTSKLEVKGSSESTYEKVGGKWMVISSVDKSQSVMVDGKKVQG